MDTPSTYRKTKLMNCLLISGWDSDFATEAYRQQVEALAQHQVSDFGNNIAYALGVQFN